MKKLKYLTNFFLFLFSFSLIANATTVTGDFNVSTLKSQGHVTDDNLLNKDLVIDGNLTADNEVINLNGYTLTVNKDFKVQGSSAKLFMPNKASMPYPVRANLSFVHGSKLYVIGGYGDSGLTDKIQIFDFTTNTWSLSNVSLSTPLDSETKYELMTGQLYNGKYYIFGGYTNSGIGSDLIYEYNPSTDSISTLTTKLPLKLYGISSVLIDSKIYLLGGYDKTNNEYLDTVYSFDLTDKSLTKLDFTMKKARYNASAIVTSNDEILIAGGDNTNSYYEKSTELVNINTLSSSNGPTFQELPNGILGFKLIKQGSDIYAVGGRTYSSTYLDTIFKLDTTNNSWEKVSTLPFVMGYNNIVTYNNENYIAGAYINSDYHLGIPMKIDLETGEYSFLENDISTLNVNGDLYLNGAKNRYGLAAGDIYLKGDLNSTAGYSYSSNMVFSHNLHLVSDGDMQTIDMIHNSVSSSLINKLYVSNGAKFEVLATEEDFINDSSNTTNWTYSNGIWIDSIEGNYENNETKSIVSNALDFTNIKNGFVKFQYQSKLESNYDYLYVEVSTDGGTVWKIVPTLFTNDNLEITGNTYSNWNTVVGDLRELAGKENIKVRLKLESNDSNNNDGISVKNIEIGNNSAFVTTKENTIDNKIIRNVVYTNGIILDKNSSIENLISTDHKYDVTVDSSSKIHNLYLNKDLVVTNTQTIDSSLTLYSNAILDLNKNSLKINGDLNLIDTTKLKMVNAEDLLEVEGNFRIQGSSSIKADESSTTSGPIAESYLTNGTLKLKGDFTQYGNYQSNYGTTYWNYKDHYYNFYAQDNHKVILNGSSKQTISFETSYSKFANLEVQNSTANAIEFNSSFNYDKLTSTNDTLSISVPAELTKGLKLDQDMQINGDLIVSEGILDLNGHTLKVTGSLYLTKSSKLKMTNASDVLEIDGDLEVAGSSSIKSGDSYSDKEITVSYLTNGVIKLKGNFTQKGTGTSYYGGTYTNNQNHKYSFYAQNNHKVILTGDSQQTITFESNLSKFANLEVQNSATDAVLFASSIIYDKLTSTNNTINISTEVELTKGLKLDQDMQINGDLTISEGTLDLNGHTLKVTGNLYLTKASRLKMTNASDVLEVDGDLEVGGSSSIQSGENTYDTEIIESYLTNGVIKLKGNFTQKGNYYSYYGGSYWSFQNHEYSFYAQDNHKVMLIGNTKQTITFESNLSKFANLELKNSSDEGIEVLSTFNFDKLDQLDDTKLTLSSTINSAITLSSDIIVESGITLAKGLDLNGNSLYVNGNLSISDGILDINAGTLKVNGNVILTKTSKLKMTNVADILEIEGDLEVGGSSSIKGGENIYDTEITESYLTNGIVKLKGNFTQKGTGTSYYGGSYWNNQNHKYSFYAQDNHKVSLIGDTTQTITFESDKSRFAVLEIKNNSSEFTNTNVSNIVYTSIATKVQPNGILPDNITLIEEGKILPLDDADLDSYADVYDDFPNDDSAWLDIDKDGKPEAYNDGFTSDNSSLELDNSIGNLTDDTNFIELAEKLEDMVFDKNIYKLEVEILNSDVQSDFKEFNLKLINTQNDKSYIIDNYEFKSITHPNSVYLEDGKLYSKVNANADVMFSYGNLALINTYSFSSIPSYPDTVNGESYASNPQELYVGNSYKDNLTTTNFYPSTTRWYKITGVKENTLYNFLYQKDKTVAENLQVVTIGDSKITYNLYKQNTSGQKSLVGSREFDPHKGFELKLVFEKDYEYFVEFSVDANLYQANYNIAVMEVTEFDEADYFYFEKLVFDDSGKIELDIILPQNTTYNFDVKSEFHSSSWLSIRNEEDTLGENSLDYSKTLPKKAGLYTFTATGEPKSKLYFSVAKSQNYKEIENNDNIINAMNYEGKTASVLASGDEDIYLFKQNGYSYYSYKPNFNLTFEEENSSLFLLTLLDTSGVQYASVVASIDSNKQIDSLDTTLASQYELDANKDYYLKVKALSDTNIKYDLVINNSKKVETKKEEFFTSLYEEWKSSKGNVTLDENLNAVFASSENTKDIGSLIILTGDSDNETDPLYKASQKLSKTIYQRFSYRGMNDNDIYWINGKEEVDLTNDGTLDEVVDSKEISVSHFVNQIAKEKESSKNGPLYIYMVDHGAQGAFKISSNDIDNDGQPEILYATTLKQSLDEFVTATNREVVVMIEACKSGSFIPVLQSDKIAVVSSSESNKLSYIDEFGNISFTKFFADELLSGNSIEVAFTNAKQKLQNQGTVYSTQTPVLSASTDLLKSIKVGGNFAAASISLTSINSISLNDVTDSNQTITLDNNKLNISATISAGSGISKVWATVITPDYTPPAIGEDYLTPNLKDYTVELTYDLATKNYVASYILDENNIYSGLYDLTVYAEDVDGFVYSKNLKVDITGNKTLDDGGFVENPTNGEDDTNTGDTSGGDNTGGDNTNTNGKVILDLDKNTWNLVALPVDVILDANSIKAKFGEEAIIWKYDSVNTRWEVGTNEVFTNTQNVHNITKIESGEGFWIKGSDSVEFEGTSYDIKDMSKLTSAVKGWSLLGTGEGLTVTELTAAQAEIKVVWTYKENQWYAYSPSSEINNKIEDNATIESLNEIEGNSGFWILK